MAIRHFFNCQDEAVTERVRSGENPSRQSADITALMRSGTAGPLNGEGGRATDPWRRRRAAAAREHKVRKNSEFVMRSQTD